MGGKKRQLLVYFIGIDGSGKSALSKYLCQQFNVRKINAVYTWWLESENSVLRRMLRSIAVGRFKTNNRRSGLNSHNKLSSIILRVYKTLYPHLVLLDYLRFGIIKIWPARIFGRNRIDVFDRFYPDVLLALSKEFQWPNSRQQKWFRLFSKFLPKPDLTLMIEVRPEIAYKRKSEEIQLLENAIISQQEYDRLSNYLEREASFQITRVNNNGDISVAENKILDLALQLVERNKKNVA